MVLSCHFTIILFICNPFLFKVQSSYNLANEDNVSRPRDWKVIESLAEENPYIVALLRSNKDYVCTGTILDKQTVLTSGICITYGPQVVAVRTAVLRKDVNVNNLHKIVYTKLHPDYLYKLKASEPNDTALHSNIGLAFVAKRLLETYFDRALIGNVYASELKGKDFVAVGYGKLKGQRDVIVLQKQQYSQSPCMNPKWYYCVCGIEDQEVQSQTYEEEFGDGGPVLLGSQVVAITAIPCGALSTAKATTKYNVFTVIGPYMTWIKKSQSDPDRIHRNILMSSGVHKNKSQIYLFVCLIFITLHI